MQKAGPDAAAGAEAAQESRRLVRDAIGEDIEPRLRELLGGGQAKG